MLETVERLMKGDETVAHHFVAAKERWEGILGDIGDVTVADLAERLSIEQSWFEHNCGSRWPGQEIMVLTGFAVLYGDGWDGDDRNGVKLRKAFEASSCSIEVKGGARSAADMYYVS